MEFKNGKIAFVTDDGTTISSHFGRALYYEIVTVENGSVLKRERVPKAGHHSFAQSGGHDHGHTDHKHEQMTSSIKDCQLLVARGMGMGARQHLDRLGISVLLTDLKTIDDTINALVAGTAVHNEKRLHDHGHHHHH